MEDNVTTTASKEETPLNVLILQGAVAFRFWWIVTIVPVGTIGNLLSMLVVLRGPNRTISCCIYMAALALCDTIMLLTNGVAMVIASVPGYLQLPLSTRHILCKADVYIGVSTPQSGVMIILAMMAERVVAVVRPFDARVWFRSSRRAMIVCMVLAIITFLYNIPVLYDAGFNKLGQSCHPVVFPRSYSFGYGITSFFVNAVIPFVAIMIMNIIILFGVKSSQKAVMAKYEDSSSKGPATEEISGISVNPSASQGIPHSQDQNESSADTSLDKITPNATPNQTTTTPQKPSAKMSAHEKQLTRMAVAVALVFLLLTMPRYIMFAVNSMKPPASPSERVLYSTVGSIVRALYVTNSACNFFLYVITGSKFRKDLMTMLRCK